MNPSYRLQLTERLRTALASSISKATIARIFTHPSVGPVGAVTGVLAGSLGSIYTPEIKAAWPFVCWTFSGCGGAAIQPWLFWVSVLAFGTIFGFGEWAKGWRNAVQLSRLETETQTIRAEVDGVRRGASEIAELIQTLPPLGLLTRFEQGVFGLAAIQNAISDGQQTVEDLKSAIRIVLKSIVDLVAHFDGDEGSVLYGANLMLFVPATTAQQPAFAAQLAKTLFVEGDFSTAKYRGLLWLDADLSTNSEEANAGPDRNIQSFGLPVPLTDNEPIGGRIRYNSLPGAPRVFCGRSLDVVLYEDTDKVVEECEREGNFTPHVNEELKAYFLEAKSKKWLSSFLSCLIPKLGADGRTQEIPTAILNIQSSKVGLVGNRSIRLFLPLTSPHRVALSSLVDKLTALQAQHK